jgi:LuxR family maltose regulon positive regulatory protein
MKIGILKDDRLADGATSAPAGTALTPLAATGDFPTGEGSRRLRILESWASAAQSRLTAVYAPLGFGKTTLLQQMKQAWLRAGGACFHLDGDLARDGESLAGFLQGAADRMFSDPSDALMSSPEIDAREIVSRIAGSLDANDVRLLVLLDGYDRLSTARNNEILRLCIKAFPDHTRFVISSRNRVRSLSSEIASSFLEIGPNELRLMPCEIAEFLGEPQGSARAEQVFKWTGGWPLAVKLANPFMSLTETEAGDIGNVAGHNRADVAGILAGEVLKNLPRAHHDALLKSAFLDKFHPDLLGDALDVEHSWRICEELERDYFLISRQDGSDWYETHPFIQRAAYRRLRATPGVSLADLQKQAARWLERKGDLQAALRLAVMAEAFDDAVQMVLDAGGVFLALRKGFDTLKAALSLLPRERRQGVERLILCEAIVMTREGRLALAADLVAGVKARIRVAAREQDDPYLHRDLA